MIACVDVDYGDAAVVAALVGFHAWSDTGAVLERVDRHPPHPAPYTPGAFFERELPYLAQVIEDAGGDGGRIELIVIDGYVWLGPAREGLGVHVHRRFGVPVVGVAKTAFAGASGDFVREVVRGDSARPLFVTAIGTPLDDAAAHVRAMHGPFRIPTLLKRVDALARGHATPRG